MPLGETPEEINTKNSKIALTVHKYLLSQHKYHVGVTSCHAAGMQYGSNSLAKGQPMSYLLA